MKKIFSIFTIGSLVILTSCVNGDDDFNNNQSQPYQVPVEPLLTNAQKELMDQMETPSVNLNVFRFFQHYLATTIYRNDARFNFTGTRKVPDNMWLALYTDVLGNLNQAKKIIPSEVKPPQLTQVAWDKQQANKLAILNLLEIYTYQVLVDSFGNVPYSEAEKPETFVLPKYDDAKTIYSDLINRLNSAIATLDAGYPSFETGDNIYNGNVGDWITMANSLKLKLGINLADVNPTLAKQTVESAFTGGVLLENSENALFQYDATSPNFNRVYAEVIASNRNDFVAEEGIVDVMNTLNDPRRPFYFTTVNGDYIGGTVGLTNTYSDYSHIGSSLLAPNKPGVLFDASEVNFYLAEAAARGYNVGATAQQYYNDAITASMEQWGVSSTSITTYLADPAVVFSSTNWKQSIGQQAWIAMFNRGFESWNFYRRLDYPVLTAPNAVAAAEGKVPTRLTYPINEQTVNGTNWSQASSAIGGDKLTTKVFWDIN
ncbi:SusD/RagB family nutrient-binding outer membrane lipoprotein [Chryseobacterium profundimaris]|uniref:Susd and RagB outer membrane lipoprotein n=1 Tax=Chryseobacterium profundimaris TaxID=1387275 RepID=A0ABY1NT49_9FLAO|nr:SusD/RagB family nutrient-binding outer membrane lipoprotein [Chryseobacterium profundimaris]SMP17286.1 Susd and RagB outer membrane lipoprotein [Chryseobacterium profundimaris]